MALKGAAAWLLALNTSGKVEYWAGVTTTPIYDGSTTNPVMINGTMRTIRSGGSVGYNGMEFVWDGESGTWQEFGETDVQHKTLDTPITVDGTQATTVEGALGAENVALTKRMTYADNGVLGAKNLNATTYTNKSDGSLTWTVNKDGTVSVNGNTSSTAVSNGNTLGNSFKSLFDAQVILSGGVSENIHIFPFDMTDNARPYTNSAKSTRLGSNDNATDTNEVSFWMEKGHTYFMALRVLSNTAVPVNSVFKPMLRLASDTDSTYQLYAETNHELTVNKADNSVIGPVEDGATASQAYAVGDHFIRGGKFCTATAAIALNDPLSTATNYKEGDVASCLNQTNGTITITASGTTAGITLGGNDIKKIGNVVCFSARFNFANALTSGYTFADLGFPPLLTESIKLPVFSTTTHDFVTIVYLDTAGKLHLYNDINLPADTYTIAGTYLAA